MIERKEFDTRFITHDDDGVSIDDEMADLDSDVAQREHKAITAGPAIPHYTGRGRNSRRSRSKASSADGSEASWT